MADFLQAAATPWTDRPSTYCRLRCWCGHYREIFNCLTRDEVDQSSAGPSANTRSGDYGRNKAAAMMPSLIKQLRDKMRTWITPYVVDLKQVVHSLNNNTRTPPIYSV